ncbi:hypothetical protein P4O66_014677, partial [Electrophorus voltai]
MRGRLRKGKRKDEVGQSDSSKTKHSSRRPKKTLRASHYPSASYQRVRSRNYPGASGKRVALWRRRLLFNPTEASAGLHVISGLAASSEPVSRRHGRMRDDVPRAENCLRIPRTRHSGRERETLAKGAKGKGFSTIQRPGTPTLPRSRRQIRVERCEFSRLSERYRMDQHTETRSCTGHGSRSRCPELVHEHSMNLSINSTTGTRFELSLPLEETVEGLKRRLSQKLRVAKDRLALLHKDTRLTTGRLQDFGITDGSKLTLVPSVEAGLMSQASRPEQTIMQALESLTETQAKLCGPTTHEDVRCRLAPRCGEPFLRSVRDSALTSSGHRGIGVRVLDICCLEMLDLKTAGWLPLRGGRDRGVGRWGPIRTGSLEKGEGFSSKGAFKVWCRMFPSDVTVGAPHRDGRSRADTRVPSLPPSQVSDFLSGRSPLTLALRVGDHMMFVQLQLAAQSSAGQQAAARGPAGVAGTSTGTCGGGAGHAYIPAVAHGSQRVAPGSHSHPPHLSPSSSPVLSPGSAHQSHLPTGTHSPTAGAATSYQQGEWGTPSSWPSRKPGAVIESFVNHAPGVFSGTFSGTLHPNCQDSDGRPRRDVSTILQILNDLLSATRHYQGAPPALTQLRCHTQSPASPQVSPPTSPATAELPSAPPSPTSSSPTSDRPPVCHGRPIRTNGEPELATENRATRCKVERLQLLLRQRRLRRRARREPRSPYPWLAARKAARSRSASSLSSDGSLDLDYDEAVWQADVPADVGSEFAV